MSKSLRKWPALENTVQSLDLGLEINHLFLHVVDNQKSLVPILTEN